jgi:hypothetical protein
MIRGRLALLPSEEAEAPLEAMASEWTEYRRLLNLLVNTYESHIDSLNKLKSIRDSRQDFQEKSSAWQGFPEPGPYSIDSVDDLWDKVQDSQLRFISWKPRYFVCYYLISSA